MSSKMTSGMLSNNYLSPSDLNRRLSSINLVSQERQYEVFDKMSSHDLIALSLTSNELFRKIQGFVISKMREKYPQILNIFESLDNKIPYITVYDDLESGRWTFTRGYGVFESTSSFETDILVGLPYDPSKSISGSLLEGTILDEATYYVDYCIETTHEYTILYYANVFMKIKNILKKLSIL